MRILKEYETKINLTADKICGGILSNEEFILNFLKENFENRCMDSSYIVAITSIKSRSMITIDKNDLSGGGSFCCVFRAESLVYPVGSVIVGARVVTVERDGKILCEYDNAIISVRGDRTFAPAKDDLIIVQVKRIGYPTGSNRMSIAAEPYYQPPTFHMNLVQVDQPSFEDKDLVDRKLKELVDVISLYESQNPKVVEFFNDLFYPYRDTSAFIAKGKVKSDLDQYNIVELAETLANKKHPLKQGSQVVISRHSAIPKSQPFVFVMTPETVKALPQNAFTDQNKINIKLTVAPYAKTILAVLDDYCNYLSIVNQCCQVYSTEQIRKSHNKLWAIYESIKI